MILSCSSEHYPIGPVNLSIPILKYLKYAAVVLLILAILAAVIHFYRESIAREFANAALSEQGITVTELSIQTLGTDYVQLSHLVLEQDDGTRYQISGLSFPTEFSQCPCGKDFDRTTDHDAGKYGSRAGAACPVAADFSSVTEQRAKYRSDSRPFYDAGCPPVDNVVWRSEHQRQHLAFSIAPAEVTVDVDRVDDGRPSGNGERDCWRHPDALSLTLSMHRDDTGFSIDGLSTISLSPWLPVLKSIGMLPTDIVAVGAELGGPVMIVLDDDETRSVPVSARLSLAGEMTADYRPANDSGIRLRANSSDPVRLSFEYPSLEWTASVGQIDIRVGTDAKSDIPVRLSDLECRSGIRCTMKASLETGPS